MENYNYIRDFKKLIIWQKANAIEQKIAIIAKGFPAFEKYNLVDQIIRCSRSIAANIAEGHTQTYIKKEITHINTALGSTGETQNHLTTAHQDNYITEDELNKLDTELIELKKMLFGYLKKLKVDCAKPDPSES
jgi:four helix bundle protein